MVTMTIELDDELIHMAKIIGYDLDKGIAAAIQEFDAMKDLSKQAKETVWRQKYAIKK